MDEITKDERFAHITKDPRFRTMSKKQRKVKIDKRFQSMFYDKKFKLKYTVDKRGRPMNFTTNENLKKYYELSDESDSDNSSSDSVENAGSDEEDELIASLSKKTQSRSSKTDATVKTKTKTKLDKKPEEKALLKKKTESVNGKKKNVKEKVKNQKLIGKDEINEETSDQEESDSEEKESGVKGRKFVQKKGEKDKQLKLKNKRDVSESEIEDSKSEGESNEEDDSGLEVGEEAPDYARGEGLIESSTDDDEEADDDEVDDRFDHQWGELDKDVPRVDDLSCRLAVCNMDWDRIKAQDLFVLFNSFKSSDGVIKSVHIYPSEFGLQRMKEEKICGPTELKELAREVSVDAEDDSEEEDDEGNTYHREKLRQYQLNRLKYYYGVVVCDSVKTASNIYDECDGKEYESSSARIDLRFIPDGMTFDHPAKSECFSLPDTTSYKSSSFFTSALCQSKVDLTWDETDQDRVKMTMKKYDKKGEINEDDFKAYLASGSEDEGEGYGNLVGQSDSEEFSDEDKQIEKYKNLLKDIDAADRKDDMEMEIEWEPGLKETTEDIVKTKEKMKDQTPWESYLQQKKEKKKQKKAEQKKKRQEKKEGKLEKAFSDDELPDGVDLTDSFFTDLKTEGSKTTKKKKKGKKKNLTEEDEEKKKKEEAELALLMMDEKEDGRQHFSLNDLVEKKKKKKKKKMEGEGKTEDDFELDLNDTRFDAVFKSHLFNIDPSAPDFKKTKGMETIIQEKLKRRKEGRDTGDKRKKVKLVSEVTDNVEKDELMPQKEESWSSLVKSVKAKTLQFQSKKKKK